MDTVEAIRLIALRDVMQGGAEYHTRYLFRWYSKTFSTPLEAVQAIDINDILQAFFEEKFEALEPEEREEQRQTLLESEEDRQKKLSEAQADKKAEDELVKMSQQANDGLEKLHTQPVKLEDLGPLQPDIKMEFVGDDEMERFLESGFANQTKKPEPII